LQEPGKGSRKQTLALELVFARDGFVVVAVVRRTLVAVLHAVMKAQDAIDNVGAALVGALRRGHPQGHQPCEHLFHARYRRVRCLLWAVPAHFVGSLKSNPTVVQVEADTVQHGRLVRIVLAANAPFHRHASRLHLCGQLRFQQLQPAGTGTEVTPRQVTLLDQKKKVGALQGAT
jgi:hypothetical protein